MTHFNHSPLGTDAASVRALGELASLNKRFVLLLRSSEDTAKQLGLPVNLYERLSLLPDEDVQRLASCPYSLFNLDFADDRPWSQMLATGNERKTPALMSQEAFALAAAIYAQRLAIDNTDLARLLLGMSRPVVGMLRNISVGKLIDHNAVTARRLRVRLIDDPHFWPDLVNYVREGTPQQYLAAQTSALQLMAAHGAGLLR